MAVEVAELRLVWPPELFAAEARALLDAGVSSEEDLGWLMAEAFAGDRGYRLLLELQDGSVMDPWDEAFLTNGYRMPVRGRGPRTDLVAQLADRAGDLPRYTPPRYYRARRAVTQVQRLTLAQVKGAFADAVGQLDATGYFEGSFGSYCCDARDEPGVEGQRQLVQLLGVDVAMWPLQQGGGATRFEREWSEEDLYDVVEALHDLVARPRRRSWHSHCEEWDYGDFSRAAGQAVYRWRVNEILERSMLPVRLAAEGEDAGRVVQVAGDDRDQLLERVLATSGAPDHNEVQHAVALFRARGAGREDRRLAVVELARVLERRRPLLKKELFKKDEGPLFDIANNFDLRHSDGKQYADYDPAFQEWIFWWYLATVELTDRLLERGDSAP